MNRKFPKGFYFGGATAAYQAEGATTEDGKGLVSWDVFLKNGTYRPDPASDFYHRYSEDLALCQTYGVNGIRISISWARIFPNGTGKVNQKGVDYYHRLIDECNARGVEPFVTLHHFDTPYELHKVGDFVNLETVDAFVDFAKFCLKEYKGKVKNWITFNEIFPYSSNQFILGIFPPNVKYDYERAFQSMHNMMVAHAKVVNYFVAEKIPGEIGIVHSLEPRYPANAENEMDLLAAQRGNVLSSYFLLDTTILGYYQPETLEHVEAILDANGGVLTIQDGDMDLIQQAAKQLDFIGVNYYQSHFLEWFEGDNLINYNGTGEKGTNYQQYKAIGRLTYNSDIERTDWDWLVYPEGLEDMLVRLKSVYNFDKKVYVTENGLGYKDQIVDGVVKDQPRVDYIKKHLNAVLNAREKGVDVQGYFVWSLMDLFSWGNGYNKRYGLFYVDFETQERIPKQSAHWWKEISERGSL